jgi:undecaprenyl-diphosphatase
MRSLNPLATALVCGTLLTVLTAIVWLGLTDEFDIAVRQWALNADPVGAETIWKKISFLGSAEVIAAVSELSVALLAILRDRRDGIHFAVIMIGAVVIENAMKLALHRARPTEVFAHTLPVSFSFPSGHSLFSAALYGSLGLIASRRMRMTNRIFIMLVAVVLILAIGLSRVFLGVHYPTDVLGGYLAAGLVIAIVEFGGQKYAS